MYISRENVLSVGLGFGCAALYFKYAPNQMRSDRITALAALIFFANNKFNYYAANKVMPHTTLRVLKDAVCASLSAFTTLGILKIFGVVDGMPPKYVCLAAGISWVALAFFVVNKPCC